MEDDESSALIARLLHEDQLDVVHPRSSDNEDEDDGDFIPTDVVKRKPMKRLPDEDSAAKEKKQPTPVKKPKVDEAAVIRKSATLSDLIREKLVQPGKDVFQIHYQNQTFHGTLYVDGAIETTLATCTNAPRGTKYPSPSAWSIACKRSVSASRQADNGWISVKYRGIPLSKVKEYYETQSSIDPESFWNKTGKPRSSSPPAEPPPPLVMTSPPPVIMTSPSSTLPLIMPQLTLPTPPKVKRKIVQAEYIEPELTIDQMNTIRQQAVSRLRKPKPSMFHKALVDKAADLDAHDLIKCDEYTLEDIPFSLQISSAAMIMMDLHAHLAHTEIIGYLAGSWDSKKKHLVATAAFPCRSIEDHQPHEGEDEIEGNRGMNVEMDPESEMDVRSAIFDRGLSIVGWYHSHPVFEPNPSVRDLENQRSYQKLFQCDQTKLYPFVGLIVGPYDMRNTNSESVFRCFVTEEPVMRPMTLPFTVARDPEQPFDFSDDVKKLIEYYKNYSERVYMDDIWRAGLGRRQKLEESLTTRFPPDDGATPREKEIIQEIIKAL